MKCPSCSDTTLVMTDRQGVEIDYCPTCRGIWLDRGELDKLLDRAASAESAPRTIPSAVMSPPVTRTNYPPDFDDSDFRGAKRHPYGRRKSWLSEIFD